MPYLNTVQHNVMLSYTLPYGRSSGNWFILDTSMEVYIFNEVRRCFAYVRLLLTLLWNYVKELHCAKRVCPQPSIPVSVIDKVHLLQNTALSPQETACYITDIHH